MHGASQVLPLHLPLGPTPPPPLRCTEHAESCDSKGIDALDSYLATALQGTDSLRALSYRLTPPTQSFSGPLVRGFGVCACVNKDDRKECGASLPPPPPPSPVSHCLEEVLFVELLNVMVCPSAVGRCHRYGREV